jgi:hypothetical protein
MRENKTKQINFKVKPSVYAILLKKADKDGLNMSELMQKFINKQIQIK